MIEETVLASLPARKLPGDWPTPRQNPRLTAVQPLPGRMRSAPEVVARLSLGQEPGQLRAMASRPGGTEDRVIAIADGRLRCYRMDGTLLWESHPAGLNFESLEAAEDLDGDGRVELALKAGRPTSPLGAAVLIAVDTGEMRFRYDLDPISYSWLLKVDHYLPEVQSKQLLVCEHGYPPDKKNGYVALFEFPGLGEKPRQRWRYDFDQYTCFPSVLTSDVDGDGVKEICVETHSRMWVLDALSGHVKQFIQWDVAPANVRSYGLVRFQDLNGDGREDFFCIANFAQHHEVLLNENGRLRLAWAHGWDNSVTTSKIATTWPEPPIADVDGDGKLEMVVSMFNSEKEPRWMIRVYDAVTGALKAKILDHIASEVVDRDGDGVPEIRADRSTDPTRTVLTGNSVFKLRPGVVTSLVNGQWLRLHGDEASGYQLPSTGVPTTERDTPQPSNPAHRAPRTAHASAASPRTAHASAASTSHIPKTAGPVIPPPLVADVDGDGVNEVVQYLKARVTIYRYDRQRGLVPGASYPSDGAPALADIDGDGRRELILGRATPNSDPVIQAIRFSAPGKEGKVLWEATLPRPNREGMPYGRPLYFQTGRFTGRKGEDLYVYAGTPIVRSLMLDGQTGKIVWEKGEVPGMQRYYAPTVNLASVYDVNGDGKEDLVFTNPDYYCVASGPTGESLVGPAFPPKIFNQPSQGLYTLPAILERDKQEATVCLVDGHYFQAAMSLHARPMWYHLPEVGEARAAAEGFMRLPDGEWLMGYGRQDGVFLCLNVASGNARWELPIEASASEVSSCDIDGDGRPEFLFGTSHGDLYAVADAGDHARVLWKVKLPASVSMPVIADIDGDGRPEILVATGDGNLCVMRDA